MPYKDEFDEPQVGDTIASILKSLDVRDKVGSRKPVWAVSFVVALLAVLGSVLWYSYPREQAVQEKMAVPIIRADAGPIKTVPSDPGGLDIPYRDSTVFETVRAGRAGEEPRIENLLDDAEEPIARDKLFAGLKTELKVEGKEIIKAAPKEAEKDIVEAGAGTAPAPKGEPAVVAAAAPTPASKPAIETAEQASNIEPAVGVETYAAGRYYVQLASLQSRTAAESAWNDLKKNLPKQLGSLKLRVQEANLGARGTYYRVQAGPVAESAARSICSAIQARQSGGCLVVGP